MADCYTMGMPGRINMIHPGIVHASLWFAREGTGFKSILIILDQLRRADRPYRERHTDTSHNQCQQDQPCAIAPRSPAQVGNL
jgi:hypothetical protein